MKDQVNVSQAKRIILFIAVLVIISLSCGNLFGASNSDKDPPPENTLPPAPGASTGIIQGPQGVFLEVAEGALSDPGVVRVEVLPASTLPWHETPFEADGPQYQLMLGDGEQLGGIAMTVPLPDPGDSAKRYVYAAWVQPERGSPSLVGAISREGKVTFPVAGGGIYQLLKILPTEEMSQLFENKAPLSVPSYPQVASHWCSPTAMTNLAGYFQGAWPAGGLGSVWGESSNWYLAGLAHQPSNKGNFFHRLLTAAGYTVPEDVYQSFSNGNATLIVWNWYAFTISDFELLETPTYLWADVLALNQKYAQELFKAFQSYVEWNLWGGMGYRRPVAWGSNLADHSRTITGSDGINLFFNDPSSGSWNQAKSWDAYYNEVMASLSADTTEIIGTLTFSAQPRPENERRAVLWLLPSTSKYEGSILYTQGQDQTSAARLIWDGQGGNDLGYYYYDMTGDLPYGQPVLAEFQATTPWDAVDYGYAIRSISEGSYEYSVVTELYNEDGKVLMELPDQNASVGSGQRVDFFPAGSISVKDLPAGLYYMKFTLMQGTFVQDVKYAYFKIAPPKLFLSATPVVVADPASRCEQFGGDYALTMLDIPYGRTALTLFIQMADGVPGLEIPVPGDDGPWEYSATLGDVKADRCSYQGYTGRLYCDFGLPENYLDTVRPLKVYVNGCDSPIFEHQRVSIFAPEEPLPACTAELNEETCNAVGGTYVCTPGIAGTVCSCTCP